MKKTKWNVLYIILALLIIFSVFVVPKIAVSVMGDTKGQIVTIPKE